MSATNSASTPASTTRSPRFAGEMTAALPDGLDGLFENVGGEPFQQCLRNINDFARIAICGLIASYEGAPTSLPDMRMFLVRRIKVEGFIVSDHLPLWPKALAEIGGLVASGGCSTARRCATGSTPRRRRWLTCCTAAISARCW